MVAVLLSALIAAEADPLFVRGDVDGDFRLAFQDAIRLLDYEFAEGPTPPCLDAADVDDDGAITLGDPVGLLLYLFAGGSAPPPPATWCGADPTPDSLPCEVTQPCRGGPIIVRGEAIPGNAFFFCLDRSVSMRGTWQGKVKLQHAKEWIIEAIDALTDDMEFSLLAFDAGMMIYSEDPIRATDREKERAIAWIMGATAGNGSCLAPAGVRTLSIANRSLLPWHRIFIVTDGTPVCNGVNTQELCLTHITEANVSKSPIDTVFVPDDGGDHDPEFLHELAARNGGEFRTVAP